MGASLMSLRGQEKPLVYDHLTKTMGALDQQVDAALGTQFHVIDVPENSDYTPPRATSGSLPTEALDQAGKKLKGYVLVAYVIGSDGGAAGPVVLKSTDVQLNQTALNAVTSWRFVPAQYEGKPVATTAAQEFFFKNGTEGFVLSHISLYQDNNVLIARMPGVDALSAYIQALGAILTSHFSAGKAPDVIDVVVGVRPRNVSKVWFISQAGHAGDFADLGRQLEAVRPIDVRDEIAFAISGTVGGATTPPLKAGSPPPIPAEWLDALKTAPPNGAPKPFPDLFLDVAWPR
jgi:TonB family protein